MSEFHSHPRPEVKKDPVLYAYHVDFGDADEFLKATAKVRDAGFSKWDTYTPFPVHGIDAAMGIKMTILPWIVTCAGLTGAATGLALQYLCNVVWYPYLIAGKPYFSLPAFIPVIFELTILFSGITTTFGMLILNGLPKWYHPLFKSKRFLGVSTDRFCIAIEAADPKFDRKKTRAFLESLGGSAVEEVED